jgi:hypothetical protein
VHGADILRGDRCRLLIEELRGLTPAVEAGLWQFVFDIDLVGEISARRRPLDDPLRWRLADPRRLRVTEVIDWLYLRILDVPTALQARGYRQTGGAGTGRLAPERRPGRPTGPGARTLGPRRRSWRGGLPGSPLG